MYEFFILNLSNFLLISDWILVFVLLINGFHDLLYDISIGLIILYKKIKFRNREKLSKQKLLLRVQQNIAIFVPAWDEGDLIYKMVKNIVEKTEYQNYKIFVGTYPNDPKTMNAVDKIAITNPQIIKVVTKSPGPTTKANCLNNIYEAMENYEKANNCNFDIILMHDSEDFVNPFELLVTNYLMPRIDVIQFPILPAKVKHSKFVHWTYADEFAVNHLRDLIVREYSSKFVPMAGVGMAFSRRVLNNLKDKNGFHVFNEIALTEDYSLSRQLTADGFKIAYISLILEDENSEGKKYKHQMLSKNSNYVSNWSYFPMEFKRAIRQKSRWITGIVLQETSFSGWKGNLRIKESLFKDRKPIVNVFLAFWGYIVVFLHSITLSLSIELPAFADFKNSNLYNFLIITSFLMIWYLVIRFVLVSRVYGIIAGFLSIPRIPLSTLINGLASWMAISNFIKRGSHKMTWTKTDHTEGLAVVNTDSTMPNTLFSQQDSSKYKGIMSVLKNIFSDDEKEIIEALNALIKFKNYYDRNHDTLIHNLLVNLVSHKNYKVRAKLPSVILAFNYYEKCEKIILKLFTDEEWIVRANVSYCSLKYLEKNPDSNIKGFLYSIGDKYANEIWLKTVGNHKMFA